jgi:hypothetical protein
MGQLLQGPYGHVWAGASGSLITIIVMVAVQVIPWSKVWEFIKDRRNHISPTGMIGVPIVSLVVGLGTGLAFGGCNIGTPTITLPPDIRTRPGILAAINAREASGEVVFHCCNPNASLVQINQTAVFTAPKPGQYKVMAWSAKGSRISEPAECTVFVEGDVPPNPPGPDPIPPTPIPQGELRVVFVYESASNLSKEQLAVLHSPAINTFLKDKCVKDEKGPSFRRWDKDINTDNESPKMKELWQAVKPKLTTLPCIVIAKGSSVEILPLPKTEQEGLELLKKYGG